jgi:hypothetical protein
VLFYAYFYIGAYEKCSSCIKEKYGIEINELIKDGFKYYEACLYFIEGRYKLCIDLLKEAKDVDRDKEGWNINKRILLILCYIELEDEESIELLVQNLEKYIKRFKRGGGIRKRYIVIQKILVSLIQENYSFLNVLDKRMTLFDSLSSKDELFRWETKTPELFQFNEWFNSKAYPMRDISTKAPHV